LNTTLLEFVKNVEREREQRNFTEQVIQDAIAKLPKHLRKKAKKVVDDLKKSWLLEDLIAEVENLLQKHLTIIARKMPEMERQYKETLKEIFE